MRFLDTSDTSSPVAGYHMEKSAYAGTIGGTGMGRTLPWMVGVIACLAGLATPARSAEPPPPTIEFRLRSINDLLIRGQYLADLVDQGDVIKSLRLVLGLLALKGEGLEGVDIHRPLGLYATVNRETISPVVMIPVAQKQRFLQVVQERLGAKIEAPDGDLYRLPLPVLLPPQIPVQELYLRFQHDYAYIGVRAKDLELMRLLAPRDYFRQTDPPAGSLVVRIDQLSPDLRKFVVAQLEWFLAESMRDQPPEDVGGRVLGRWLAANLTDGLDTLLRDVQELNIQVDVNVRQEELLVELSFVPRPDSHLARQMQVWSQSRSFSYGIIQAAEGNAPRAAIHWTLPPQSRKLWNQAVDEIIKDALDKAKPDERPFVEGIFKAIAPTLQSGVWDIAAAVVPPANNGHHKLLAAMALREGKSIETMLKNLAPILAAVEVAEFSFDRDRLGEFRIHSLIVQALPEELERLFGTHTIWLGLSDSQLVLTIEPDGQLLRNVLKQVRPSPAPLLHVETTAAALIPILLPDIRPDEVKALHRDAFGDKGPSGRDQFRLTVTAEQKLRVTIQAKGPSIRLIYAAGLFK